MLRDTLLAWAHFITIFALVGTVVAEFALYRPRMDSGRLQQLQRIDLGYGVAAVLVILTGIARVTFGLKGAGFYLGNPVFWTKMSLFVLVGLLSIPPTMHYLRVKKSAAGDGSVEVAASVYRQMRGLLGAELALLAVIPLFAALLAHGYR